MPDEVKRKRGRPPKHQETIIEQNTVTHTVDDKAFEYNSITSSEAFEVLFKCGVYDYFDKEAIDAALRNPISNHDIAIRLSRFIYNKNGVVSNSIDYMVSLPCLDRVLIPSSKRSSKKNSKNNQLMDATLKTIDDKHFIRDALFKQMINGIAFFYFETTKKMPDNRKFMTDYDVENIYEINQLGINAAIISLPWEYTRIVGKKNNRYVLAFDLRYFDNYDGVSKENKLRKYPKEIVNAYNIRKNNPQNYGNWAILDNNKTMCRKIKSEDSEPWGRSLIIAALEDVLYKDYFVDTKRNVLDDLNSKVIYETYPEGKEKGSCALTKTQQIAQHEVVKTAILNKNNRKKINFFSVAAGTKLDSIDVSTDIFDDKNESNLNNQISLDMGICASLIGAMTTGNFAAGQNNLEMINAQIYTWVYEWQAELNHVINKNVIQDENNPIQIYYFPTSFVNKKSFFDMMKDLYMSAGGSLKFLIASTGIDPDSYLAVLDEEIDDGLFEKYLPHMTSYTMSSKEESEITDDKGGRPAIDNPTNENTIKSKGNGSNNIPKPSTID